jgi:hypothetical protein
MSPRVRPLSAYQAANCEHALEPVCRCRCGGALHGAKRLGLALDPAGYFLLPPDDPHYAEPVGGAFQLALSPDFTNGGVVGVRVLAPDPGAVGALPDPDIRPQAVPQ